MGLLDSLFSKKKAQPNAFNSPKLNKPTTSVPTVAKSLLFDDSFEPTWWRRGVEIPVPYPKIVLSTGPTPTISPIIRDKVGKALEGRFKLPSQTSAILEALQQPDANVASISTLLTRDPMMVALLLKVVNSAQYGLAQKITSVNRALSLLGLSTLKQLVLAQATSSLIKSPEDRDRFKKLWIHGAMTSICSQGVSKTLPVSQSNWEAQVEATTIGLIVNMGKILLRPEETGILAAQTGMSEAIVEGYAASCFAQTWGMPKRVAQVLEAVPLSFRYPLAAIPEEIRTTTVLVSFASFVTRVHGFEDGSIAELPPLECLEFLGWFAPSDRHWVTAEVARDMEKVRIAMESTFAI